MRTALNNAKSRQLRVEQNYDIVTHSTFLSAEQARSTVVVDCIVCHKHAPGTLREMKPIIREEWGDEEHQTPHSSRLDCVVLPGQFRPYDPMLSQGVFCFRKHVQSNSDALSHTLRAIKPLGVSKTTNLAFSKQEPPARRAPHPDTRTSYDILNHVPREKAHSVALIYAEGEGPEIIPQKVVTVEGGKKPHSHQKRDVDVLSNRFVVRAASESTFLLLHVHKERPSRKTTAVIHKKYERREEEHEWYPQGFRVMRARPRESSCLKTLVLGTMREKRSLK